MQAVQLNKQVQSGDAQLQILSDISLSINIAETVAIMGASGSGKTTLLSLLAGLDMPSSGHVILNGRNLNDLNEDGRAHLRLGLVGFVFQSFQLLPHMTALENVMLPLELVNDHQAKQKAQSLLSQVGLSARAHHYPMQLSGGEQQRIAIARAYISKPEILFADEPTGNLDQHTGIQIIDLLFELNEKYQTTLVIVTHDESLANRCRRHIKLVEGRIITS